MSASILMPQVQRMLDTEGLYLCSGPNGSIPFAVFSTGGQLIVLQVGKALDPTRFIDGVEVRGPITLKQEPR